MYGMPSCYNSGFVFARRFARSGVDIHIASDSDISKLAAKAGVKFFHLDSISHESNLNSWLSIKNKLKIGNKVQRVLKLIKAKLDFRRKTIADTQIQQLVSSIKPDVLLIDIECHVAIISSTGTGVPTALCTRMFDHRPGGYCPPLNSNVIPSTTPYMKIIVAAQWYWLHMSAWGKSLRQSISINRLAPLDYRTAKMPDIKAIARQNKVDLRPVTTTRHWFRPLTYVHLPIFSMTLKELDFERADRTGFDYIGPMIDNSDYAFESGSPLVDQIERFISTSRSENKTIVYCAMGTFAQREPRFVEAMRDLAATRKDLALLISLGGRESTEDYSSFPSNCLLLDSAPQLQCLQAADAAILHSGIASLHEALKYRVPLLIFAVDSMDQNGNAVRWTELGLAKRFYLKSVSGADLAASLDDILADKKLAVRLRTYSELMELSSNRFSPRRLVEQLVSASVSIN